MPEAAESQLFARALLQAINREPLPAGFDAAGEKATRAYGRSLLVSSGFWPRVRERLASSNPPGDAERFAAFLEAFEASFKDGVVSKADVELGELVWARDMSAVLRARGQARAKARAADAIASEDAASHAALHQLVSAGLTSEE